MNDGEQQTTQQDQQDMIQKKIIESGLALKLPMLDISCKHIKSIPQSHSDSFFTKERCFNLTKVYLFNNSLTRLDSANLFALSSLEYLDLSNNLILTLSSDFFLLSNLKFLNCSSNLMRSGHVFDLTPISSPQILQPSSSKNSPNSISAQISTNSAHLNEISFDSQVSSSDIDTLDWQNEMIAALDSYHNELDLYSHDRSFFHNKMVSLSYIDLSRNFMECFPDDLCYLPSLETLLLAHNNISSVSGISLSRGFSFLKKLDLEDNDLSSLPPQMCLLGSLVELNLDWNRISSLPDQISLLPSLQILSLSNNLLETIPESFSKFSSLWKLLLNSNRISSIPETLWDPLLVDGDEGQDEWNGLWSLHELDLSKNMIQSLPESFWCRSVHLQNLAISFNLLKHIPKEISCLSNLASFDACFNQISTLPSELGSLEYLEDLNLAFNSFDTLPPEIVHLAMLKKANFSHNKLRTIPLNESPEFLEWESLEELHLDFNPLEKLPTTLGNLWGLVHLTFSGCGLSDVPAAIFENMSSLQKLDLTENQLKEVPNIRPESSSGSLSEADLDKSELRIDIAQNLIPIEDLPMADEDAFIHFIDEPGILKEGVKEKTRHVESDLSLAGWSETIGRRSSQEDTMVIMPHFGGRQMDVYAIFDGHAGAGGAEFCAKSLSSALQPLLELNEETGEMAKDPSQILRTSIPTLNKDFRKYTEKHKSIRHSGCCALVAVITPTTLHIANLGDTRAVLGGVREGTGVVWSERVSVDHKPGSKTEMMRIQSLGGYVTEINGIPRVNGMLAVARSIGDAHLYPIISDIPYLHEHLLSSVVPKNDYTATPSFLILACDGLWDEIEDQEASELVNECLSSGGDPSLAASILRDAAFAAGSDDNISVIVVSFTHSQTPSEILLPPIPSWYPSNQIEEEIYEEEVNQEGDVEGEGGEDMQEGAEDECAHSECEIGTEEEESETGHQELITEQPAEDMKKPEKRGKTRKKKEKSKGKKEKKEKKEKRASKKCKKVEENAETIRIEKGKNDDKETEKDSHSERKKSHRRGVSLTKLKVKKKKKSKEET